MALRRRQPEPVPEPCGCEQRIAELEQAVAALARAAVLGELAPDVRQLPGNHRVDNRADAAVIRAAGWQRPGTR